MGIVLYSSLFFVARSSVAQISKKQIMDRHGDVRINTWIYSNPQKDADD